MRKRFLSGVILLVLGILGQAVSSCGKEFSSSATSSTTRSSSSGASTTSTSSTIAVATDSSSADSVYIIQSCAKGYYRDSVGASGLPDSITSFLNSNYPGYSFLKAFEIRDSAGTIGGYVVIVSFDGKPVGLLFTAEGSLVQVLEQREAGDLSNRGWHEGGHFSGRNGMQHDTVALTSLPSPIIDYFSTHYSQDTLLKAFRNADSSYLVISADNGLYANLFNSGGTFINREELPAPGGQVQAVIMDSLPAAILIYLSSTYPDYVPEKAFTLLNAGQVSGYLVVLDANSTKYAVWFDPAGNMIAVRTVW